MRVQRVACLVVAMLALGLCAGGLCAAAAGTEIETRLWAGTGPAKIVMMSAVGRVAESAVFFGAVVAAVLGALLLLWAVLRGTGRLCAAVASFEPNVTTDAVLVGGTCVTCWLGWRAGLGGPDTTFFAWCAAANVAMWSAAAAARLALPAVLVVVRAFSRRGGVTDGTSKPGRSGRRKPKKGKMKKHRRSGKKRKMRTRRAFMRGMRALHKISDEVNEKKPDRDTKDKRRRNAICQYRLVSKTNRRMAANAKASKTGTAPAAPGVGVVALVASLLCAGAWPVAAASVSSSGSGSALALAWLHHPALTFVVVALVVWAGALCSKKQAMSKEVTAANAHLEKFSQDKYDPADESQRAADEAAAETQLAADAAEVKQECEAPLPDDSSWLELGGDELEEVIWCTGILSVRWLIDFIEGRVMPERRGVLPAWQELPPEAFVSISELRKSSYIYGLPIAVFSYGWAGRRHPDPTGEQLRRALPALKSMVNGEEDMGGGSTADWGLVIDYAAYPQNLYTGPDPKGDSRTPYQRRRFDKGLKSVNRWYGAPYVTTLVCDWDMPEGSENTRSILVRGWCRFERALSSISKYGWCYLHLSQLPEGAEGMPWWGPDGVGIAGTCSTGARRPAPEAPDAFEKAMLDGMKSGEIRFTNGKDATGVCIPQYKEGFLRLMGTAKLLDYESLKWGPAEAERLAAAFAYAAQHEGGAAGGVAVEKLYLQFNQLGSAGVRAVGRAIEAGYLPRLKTLWINNNGADDETREWIERVAKAAGCTEVDA